MCDVPQGAGYSHRAVVPQIPPDLAGDHRNSISGKLHLLGNIKIVHRFDESDTTDLKEIVNIFAASGKSLDHRQYKAEVSGDQLLSRLLIAGLGPDEQLPGLLIFQYAQLCRVYPADLYLALQIAIPLAAGKQTFAGRDSFASPV